MDEVKYYVHVNGYCRDEMFFETFDSPVEAAEFIKTRLEHGSWYPDENPIDSFTVICGYGVTVKYISEIDDIAFD